MRATQRQPAERPNTHSSSGIIMMTGFVWFLPFWPTLRYITWNEVFDLENMAAFLLFAWLNGLITRYV